MVPADLRSKLHQLIDQTMDDRVLDVVHSILRASEQRDSLWTNLSLEQQAHVLASFEESENESLLIPAEQVIKGL